MDKKMKTKIIVFSVIAIMIFGVIGLGVFAADTTPPIVEFYQDAGQIVKSSQVGIYLEDENGVVEVRYCWDFDKGGVTDTVLSYASSPIKVDRINITAPSTLGVHILKICAVDKAGNVSVEQRMPYYVVDAIGATDTIKPTFNVSGMPANNSNVRLNTDITIKPVDEGTPSTGIARTEYRWVKAPNDTTTKYTVVYQKDAISTKVPSIGKWYLQFYTFDATKNQSATMTYCYNVVDYVVSIDLDVTSLKKEYEYKEAFNFSGGYINVHKASGATERIALNANNTKGFNSNELSDAQVITVTYEGKTKTFTVKVKDTTPPVITLVGNSEITIPVSNTEYKDAGATAKDIYDTDKNLTTKLEITSNNVNTSKVGDYTVVYTATDSRGNKSTKTRTVHVRDQAGPVITINANNVYEMFVKGTKPEFRATANDAYDGATNVVITDDINVNVAGTYTVTFTATDKAGNKTVETRSFTVKRKTLELDNFKTDINLDGTTKLEYNTSGQGVNVTPIEGAGDISVSYNKVNEDGTKTPVEGTPVDNGVYEVVVSGPQGTDYDAFGPIVLGTYEIVAKPQPTPDVTYNDTNVKLTENKELKVVVNNAPLGDGQVTFVSSDPSVLTVDENGKITLLKVGSANITVVFGGSSDGNYSETSSSPITITVERGDFTTDLLTYTIEDKNYDKNQAQGITVTDKAGNTASAEYGEIKVSYEKVNEDGSKTPVTGTPKNVGTYEVFVEVTGGTQYNALTKTSLGTYKINPLQQPKPTFTLDKYTTFITKSAPVLTLTNAPEENGDGVIYYASSNPDVLTIDQTGKITVHGVGEANITVTYRGTANYTQNVSDEVTVTVSKDDTLTKENFNYDLTTKGFTGNPQGIPEVTAKDEVLAFGNGAIGNISVTYVKIDKDGNRTELGEGVVPSAAGTYEVTLHVAEGTHYKGFSEVLGTYTITAQGQVKPQVSVNPQNVTMVDKAPVITVSNTPAENGNITYTSSDPSVLTIDKNGNITILKAGSAQITVTFGATDNYSETSSDPITVTVTKADFETGENGDFTYDYTLEDKMYTGQAQGISVTDKDGKTQDAKYGEITVSYKKDGKPFEGIPTEVGTYEVTVNVTGGTHYNEFSEVLGTYQITKKPQDKPQVTVTPIEVKITENAPQISVTNAPKESGNITYTSSNENVLTIATDGKVTLVGAGEATITVTFGQTANYSEMSSDPIKVTVLKDTLTKEHLAYDIPETKPYEENPTGIEVALKEELVEKYGENAIGNIKVIYEKLIDGTDIVSETLVGDAVPTDKGTYRVSVTVAEGTHYYALSSTVLGKYTITAEAQPTPEVTINPINVKMTEKAPVITVSNINAIKGDGQVTYTSSNPSVLSVDENGIVTLNGAGQANITVTFGATTDGNYVAKSSEPITITVEKEDLSIEDFDYTIPTNMEFGKTTPIVVTPKTGVKVETSEIHVTYSKIVMGEGNVPTILPLGEEMPTEVGTYIVALSVDEGKYYEALPTTTLKTFNITAKPLDDVNDTVAGLVTPPSNTTYTGSGIGITESNVSNVTLNGNEIAYTIESIKYRAYNEETQTWGTPVADAPINVGTYKAVVEITVANHSGVRTIESVGYTITPKALVPDEVTGTVTTPTDLTYTGNPIGITDANVKDVKLNNKEVAYTVESIQYAIYNEETQTWGTPTNDVPVNVGTYKAVVTIKVANHTGTKVLESAEYTITAGTLVPDNVTGNVGVPSNTVYTGNPIGIDKTYVTDVKLNGTAVKFDVVTIQYKAYNEETKEWGVAEATQPVNVGKYKAVVTIKVANYDGTKTLESAEYTITPKALEEADKVDRKSVV